MTKDELLNHLRLDIAKGGHATAMWRNDPAERIIDKHRKDHQIWPGMLKHNHPKPITLQAPNAV